MSPGWQVSGTLHSYGKLYCGTMVGGDVRVRGGNVRVKGDNVKVGLILTS